MYPNLESRLTPGAARIVALSVLLACAAAEAAAQPDAFGYTATNNVAWSYLNISGTGTSVMAGSDDASAVLSIPFPFRFYGVSYSSVCVSSNGVLSFGSCIAGDFANLDLTSQTPQGNQPLIAPFWTDLTFGSQGAGSVFYQTLGTQPARRFIVQWNNAAALNTPGSLNFQAVLFEGSNNILFQYGSVASSNPQVHKGASATVGIRAASGQANNQRLQWSYQAPVIESNSAIRFDAPTTAAAVDVSSKVRVTTSAFVLNRLQGRYNGTITITNTSTEPIARPLTIVLTGLTTGVTAFSPSGLTPAQEPFYAAPGTGPLAPGQSATVAVSFVNPANARISFTTRTWSGAF